MHLRNRNLIAMRRVKHRDEEPPDGRVEKAVVEVPGQRCAECGGKMFVPYFDRKHLDTRPVHFCVKCILTLVLRAARYKHDGIARNIEELTDEQLEGGLQINAIEEDIRRERSKRNKARRKLAEMSRKTKRIMFTDDDRKRMRSLHRQGRS